jgi:hypothetical protein
MDTARGPFVSRNCRQRRVEAPHHPAARQRMLIHSTCTNDERGAVGVSENIIEASLQALADSMEFAHADCIAGGVRLSWCAIFT